MVNTRNNYESTEVYDQHRRFERDYVSEAICLMGSTSSIPSMEGEVSSVTRIGLEDANKAIVVSYNETQAQQNTIRRDILRLLGK